MKATKGLDRDLAWKALDGGQSFGDNDRGRYNSLVKDRDAKAAAEKKKQEAAAAAERKRQEAKERAQQRQQKPKPPAKPPC